jgi:Ca2+:H+ antiporter
MTRTDKIFLALLVFVPLALGAAWATSLSPILVFILSALALAPLAKFLSDATESLAERVGPAAGGLLNATFGNAPELIVSIFALSAGLVDVVKASLIGSILGNLLLGLGLALFAGGIGRMKQSFNITAARSNATTLLLAATAFVMAGVLFLTPGISALVIGRVSIAVSVLLIIAYIATLVFSLGTHKHLYMVEADPDTAGWTTGAALLILIVATLGIALVSDTLVGALSRLIGHFGWPPLFVGAIVLALAGNVGEYVAAIRAALSDKVLLATQISLGSATQLMLFVIPAIVIVSSWTSHAMNLVFTLFELVAAVSAIFIVNSIIEDGETNWLEGALLLTVYAVMGVAFFFHP